MTQLPEDTRTGPRRGPDILCACGKQHRLTPTAMAAVIQGFINGDAQRIDMHTGVYPMCIVEFLKNLPKEYVGQFREDRIGYE